MKIIECRNVSEALWDGIDLIQREGVLRESRNGPVLQMPCPVTTVYKRPWERVLFHKWRDANPFFHFYESLWMLAGRQDVAPLTRYVKRMVDFSDDGKIFNAAYGYRWRTKCTDQLTLIVKNLAKNSDDRRQVLKIWSGKDLGSDSKDVACNLTATFQINPTNNALDMTVFCRSNDIIWGAYGANAVHFSFLQEYMARSIGIDQGVYTHISVNWHAYKDVLEKTSAKLMSNSHPYRDLYRDAGVEAYPIMTAGQLMWDIDVDNFITDDGKAPRDYIYHDEFFPNVALPIVSAHDAFKLKDFDRALSILENCKAQDWKIACTEWIKRRLIKDECNGTRRHVNRS